MGCLHHCRNTGLETPGWIAEAMWVLFYVVNTVAQGSGLEPVIFHDRLGSVKNKSHRQYRIFLQRKMEVRDNDEG